MTLRLGISLVIASLLAGRVAKAGTGLPATATAASLIASARQRAAPARTVRSMFRGSYEPPKNPEHDALYEDLKGKQIPRSDAVR